MSEKIRIVSDLHVGHHASVIEDISTARALTEDVDRLIFNGDTLELMYGDLNSSHYNATKQKELFDRETASWGIKIDLVTGNHDPSISDTHSLSICDNQIFITHGDSLFKEVAPWSSNVKNLSISSSRINVQQTGRPEDLHAYLAQFKQVSIDAHKLEDGYNPTLWGKTKILLHQAWPPTTPFKILSCWRQVPDRAISLAKRFGLDHKFIVVGHTHNPGVWQRDGRIVINLGAYFPWPGARCIDIDGRQLVVRKISKRNNRIALGKAIATFQLS